MARISSTLFWIIAPASLLGTLSACSEPAATLKHDFNNHPAGRYRIVHIPGTGEVIEMDTASGKTWLLDRQPMDQGGGVIGWTPIKDQPEGL